MLYSFENRCIVAEHWFHKKILAEERAEVNTSMMAGHSVATLVGLVLVLTCTGEVVGNVIQTIQGSTVLHTYTL